MIKFIASDMDGTLLDRAEHIPDETFELIGRLGELGVRFCPCSGRDHSNLVELFAPVVDYCDFICSNGMEVYAREQLIGFETLSYDAIVRLAQVVSLFDAHHMCVSGPSGTIHVCDDTPEKFESLKRFVIEEQNQIPDWFSYGLPSPDDPMNTGFFVSERQEELADFAYILTLELGDEFIFNRINVTEGYGMDFSPRHTTKATAIQKIMRAYGMTADEVLVYGDSMNDYGIMRTVAHSACMDNGMYAVKQIAERVIESNLEHGVQKDMARIIADLEAGGDGVISFDVRQEIA